MSNFSSIAQRFPVYSLVFCFVLTGCGEPKPEGFPTLYPLTLTFVQDGGPCADTTIILVPQDSNPWTTGGVTDANGVVTFRTHGKHSGVPAGTYKITASKIEQEFIYGPGGEVQKANNYCLINPDYGSPDKSPFAIEVVAGKNNFEPFDLGKKVRVLQSSSY